MTDESFFSRRLTSTELDIWLELGKMSNSKDNDNYAEMFMNLDSSMFFVSYVGEDLVGGTAIYKDQVRLGMALINARIVPNWRERASPQIVKSSLPFFRSLSIRDVDAIIGLDESQTSLSFPFNFVLDQWTQSALEKNGFEEESRLFQVTGDIPASIEGEIVEWDPTTNLNGVKELFWKSDLKCSLFWYLMDIHKETGIVHTSSDNEEVRFCFGISEVNSSTVMVTLLMNNSLIDSETIANSILYEARKLNADRIVFPIISEHQLDLVNVFEALTENAYDRRELKLLRKTL
ncbi:MAG: hypothetical protein ACTSU3_08920 [Candidatus Thorarchaeota archaeon]